MGLLPPNMTVDQVLECLQKQALSQIDNLNCVNRVHGLNALGQYSLMKAGLRVRLTTQLQRIRRYQKLQQAVTEGRSEIFDALCDLRDELDYQNENWALPADDEATKILNRQTANSKAATERMVAIDNAWGATRRKGA